jgi:hypothetical protein
MLSKTKQITMFNEGINNSKFTSFQSWICQKVDSFEYKSKKLFEDEPQPQSTLRGFIKNKYDRVKHKLVATLLIKGAELFIAYEIGHFLAYIVFFILFENWKRRISQNNKLIPSIKK